MLAGVAGGRCRVAWTSAAPALTHMGLPFASSGRSRPSDACLLSWAFPDLKGKQGGHPPTILRPQNTSNWTCQRLLKAEEGVAGDTGEGVAALFPHAVKAQG